LAGGRVDRHHVGFAGGEIQRAVVEDRRGFPGHVRLPLVAGETRAVLAAAEGPGDLQVFHVRGRDLRGGRIARAFRIATEMGPAGVGRRRRGGVTTAATGQQAGETEDHAAAD